MHTLFKDFRYGIRSLLRHPTFTIVAVITLSLSIGANTAIFSVVNDVLLRALPFQNPERLVSIGKSASGEGLPGLAAFEYLAWREKGSSFEDISAYGNDNYNLTGRGEPERISCAEVTASFFTTLGVSPIRGRVFLPEEDQKGRNQVILISEGYWQSRFSRGEDVVGSTLTLDEKPYTIVGVMPRSFRFPGEFDFWVPLALDPVRETQGNMFTLVEVVGRLKPGASAEGAQAELNHISAQTAQQMKEQVSPSEIVPLHQQLVAGVRRTVLVLWGAVGLIMLLACANVANLMLSRTVGRQREMAVRSAVGARRWQLIRQLLIESVVLGLIGGLLGILVAVWSKGVIAALVPEGFTSSIHHLNEIKMDWRVFGFTLLLSLITGIIFGLVPSLTASKPDLVRTLRETGISNQAGFGLRSVRGWLVVVELSLAMVLLLAAGLLVRSFNQLLAIDLGFARENVLTLRLELPRSKYSIDVQTVNFNRQLIERVKRLPGVQSVGTTSHKPLSGFGIIVFTGIEDQGPPDQKKDKPLGVGSVTSDYFRTLGIPLLSGRTFDDRDSADSSKVAIVNQAFARRYFGSKETVGKHVGFGCKEDLCRTIVGVVGNVRQESLTDDVAPEMYVPFPQMPMNGMTLLVQTTTNPLSLAGSIRNEVLAIDPNQPLHDVKTMEQRVAESVSVSRSLMFLFSSFAVLALVLASVGIYGIVSYSVSQRTVEIGIRMALGANDHDVLKLVLRTGFVLVLTGVAIGITSGLVLTRFLTTLLYGIEPTDVSTFVLVPIGLLAVALVACLIPARRATKVDPLVALRYE
ncbi:MAG TPA: ABC transporter permease [Pyrinomonadaceae bacterium]|jgi:putative ABC transport system permease protein|nr:ABC transporter permease [Pyrinomonadaceae bacterium]